MNDRRPLFLAGLFLTTSATLQIEILCTRLLSVMAWYHLSFLAVSIAMLGMAGGAVRAYTDSELTTAHTAPRVLAKTSLFFALSIPLSHAISLCVPMLSHGSTVAVISVALTVLILTIPFYLSGIVVAVALTRVPGPSGLIYSCDLCGAAVGSLLVVHLLNSFSVSAATFLCSAVAAAGALCFNLYADTGRVRTLAALVVFLLAFGLFNDHSAVGLRVAWSKGILQRPEVIVAERWTSHGQVTARHPAEGPPHYWGRGRKAPEVTTSNIWMTVDGAAGTAMTRWDQQFESLQWSSHDVTSLAYHLRQEGDVAVIGVGGGRDLLSALWSRARSITGIEVNRAFLDLLEGQFRIFAGLVDRPEIKLIHDEARSYMTRTRDRFDLIQMSMIDSWAATGAGAYTLSENGLYTVEGWLAMLATLEDKGLFTVSRWHTADRSSESSRLISLAAATLLERGVAQPEDHLLLVGRQKVATLVLSVQPFTKEELQIVRSLAEAEGFALLVAPDNGGSDALLSRFSRVRSRAELEAAVAHERFDQRPPTDERPFFFNVLSPRGVLDALVSGTRLGVIATGNLIASMTLALLWIVVVVYTVGLVVVPLKRFGIPHMSGSAFSWSMAYFILIGLGFMFVQIPLLQRFSIFLGHPTYALAVVLFAMILFAGIGSLLSDRVPDAALPRTLRVLSGIVALLLVTTTISLQPLIDHTIAFGMLGRAVVVCLAVGFLALPMGMFFPLGLRLVRRISDDASPWLWGLNGAAGVVAAVSAVAISMWWGISFGLLLAALAYALLALPIRALSSPPV